MNKEDVEIVSIPVVKRYMGYSPIKNKIFVSYGELSQASNKSFITSVYHEIGHRKNRIYFFLEVLLFETYILLCLCLPIFFYGIIFLYLFMCWCLREDEYRADRYAYENISMDYMIEFLGDRKTDTKLKKFLYLFCWRPFIERRYDKICQLSRY